MSYRCHSFRFYPPDCLFYVWKTSKCTHLVSVVKKNVLVFFHSADQQRANRVQCYSMFHKVGKKALSYCRRCSQIRTSQQSGSHGFLWVAFLAMTTLPLFQVCYIVNVLQLNNLLPQFMFCYQLTDSVTFSLHADKKSWSRLLTQRQSFCWYSVHNGEPIGTFELYMEHKH